MADDLAGLKTTLKEALEQLVADKAFAYNSESEMRVIRALQALIKARATANGVTGL